MSTACGTLAGHKRHVRAHESACDACRAVRASYMRGWRASRRRVARREVMVGTVGVVRRLRAMARDGITSEQIAAHVYLAPSYVTALWRGERNRVFVNTAAAIARAYETRGTWAVRSDVTALRAELAGWESSVAWDEETIDDPAACPNRTGFTEEHVQLLMDGERVAAASEQDRDEAARRLVDVGLLPHEIARLTHSHVDVVLARLGRCAA